MEVVLAALGEDADRALFDDVKARFANAEDAELRENLLLLLGRARSAELAPSALALALDPSLRPVEVLTPLALQLESSSTREAAWQWLKAHYDALLAAVPKEHGQAHLVELASVFCDVEHAKDVEAFYTPERLAKVDGGPRALASTLEEIRLCAVKRKVQEPSARQMFGKK
jgi:alanyl aminopeptidase